jgi:hypothetical protein
MMRGAGAYLFLASAFAANIFAQDSSFGRTTGAADGAVRDSAIESLVRDARAAPPEFAADALLRLAASKSVDPDWKRELLEEAYLAAYSAPLSYSPARVAATR